MLRRLNFEKTKEDKLATDSREEQETGKERKGPRDSGCSEKAKSLKDNSDYASFEDFFEKKPDAEMEASRFRLAFMRCESRRKTCF